MMLLLLSRFSHVGLCVTPQTAAHQASRPWDSPDKNTGVGCHFPLQCMKVKSEKEVAQSCPTLCNPMDCSLPGSSVHGIFWAKVLEWGAIAFSINSSRYLLIDSYIFSILLSGFFNHLYYHDYEFFFRQFAYFLFIYLDLCFQFVPSFVQYFFAFSFFFFFLTYCV